MRLTSNLFTHQFLHLGYFLADCLVSYRKCWHNIIYWNKFIVPYGDIVFSLSHSPGSYWVYTISVFTEFHASTVGRFFWGWQFSWILRTFCFTRKLFLRNITRIHCDTQVLHGFIVIYWINMALLKYLKKTMYCLTWRVLCLTLCHHLQLLQQTVMDLVDVAGPTIFISHGYIRYIAPDSMC